MTPNRNRCPRKHKGYENTNKYLLTYRCQQPFLKEVRLSRGNKHAIRIKTAQGISRPSISFHRGEIGSESERRLVHGVTKTLGRLTTKSVLSTFALKFNRQCQPKKVTDACWVCNAIQNFLFLKLARFGVRLWVLFCL